MANFNMADYKTVAERLSEAHVADAIESIRSDNPIMLNDVMGYVRVTVLQKDGTIASAIASFRLDALKGAQKTNPLEDAETSALGRALGFLGYSSSRSIASREEIAIAQDRADEPSIKARQNAHIRINELREQCRTAGLVIEHDLASLKLSEMNYDELVVFGKYLKGLLG